MKLSLKVAGLIFALVAIALIAGCAKQPGGTGATTSQSDANTINVLVPCGQTGPYFEIKDLFIKANPDVKVQELSENIAVITRKVLDGDSPEVFMSMGDREVTQLEQKDRIIPDTRTAYAINALVLIAPKGNPAKVKDLKDVAGPAVKRFVVVNPDESSAGFHSKEALQKLGIWDKVVAKTQVPDQPGMVDEILAKGDAEAGIGYWPCLTESRVPGSGPTPKKRIAIAQIIPQDLYTPFKCEAAVIKGCKNPELGKKFIDFMMEPQSQAIFAKWNFTDPNQSTKEQPKAK